MTRPAKIFGSLAPVTLATMGALAALNGLAAVAPPRDAGYVLRDGSIQIVGFGDMDGIIARIDDLFAQDHPGFRFTRVKSNSLAALYSLAYDATAFAPVGSEFLAGAAGSYAIMVKGEPFGIRVAHASLNPDAAVSPLAIVVNRDNPIDHLSAGQVAHIFTVGGRQRDLTHWGQVGAAAGWEGREIHPCGLPESDHYRSEDIGFGEFMFVRNFGGGHCARNYEMVPTYAGVAARVAADPLAIGITALNRVTPGVRVVAVGGGGWAAPARGTREEIVAGKYPYDRYLYLYVRRVPGKPLDPFLREYLLLILSREGQAAIAGESHGYLPLNPVELGEERSKVGNPEASAANEPAPAGVAEPAPKSPVSPPGGEPSAGPPADASYVQPDGSIYVSGNDLMVPFFEQLNALFAKAHPGFKFKMDMYASSLAISGLTSGKSAFGPMGRDATFQDQDAFTSRYGYAPTDIQVGWDNTPDADHFPPNGKYPPAVWVNARNPVPALSVQEIIAIFTTGSRGGDITHWGQIAGDEGPVGANGADWAKRAIHVYLPSLRGLPIISTTRQRFGDLPWTPAAEHLPLMEDVINAVANDPFGIGFIGWWPDDEGWDRQVDLGSKIRLMPLSPDHDSRISHGGPGDLYPLAGGLHLFVNRAPGKPLAPWLAEYLRLALSKQGQDILAGLTRTDGFIPLDPDDVPAQLAKIE